MSTNSKELEKLPDNSLICYCAGINKGTIKEAILAGASSIKELGQRTSAGLGNRCKELNPAGRCCHTELRALIDIYGKGKPDNNLSDTCCCCD